MPQNPTLEERRLLTLRLRIAGWSYREIATRVGVSPAQVFRDIKRVCDQLRKEQYATAAQLRTQTAMALEEKLARWWTRADADPVALDRVIKLLAERSKLFGLHAPPQQQVELQDHKPPEITVHFVDTPGPSKRECPWRVIAS